MRGFTASGLKTKGLRRVALVSLALTTSTWGLAAVRADAIDARPAMQVTQSDQLVAVRGSGFPANSTLPVTATVDGGKGTSAVKTTASGTFSIRFAPAAGFSGPVSITASSTKAGIEFNGAAPSSSIDPAIPTTGTLLTTLGAKCDGTTDDTAALQAAIAKGGNILVPEGQCRLGGGINLPNKVTIAGKAKTSTLLIDSAAGITVTGTGAQLLNLNLVRRSAFGGVMIKLNGSEDFTMSHIVIDGKKETLKGPDYHGIVLIGDAGTTNSNTKLLNSTITNTDYGLFQASETVSTNNGFLVDKSTFTKNYMDDLEFNAPNSKMSNVTVTNSKFSDNLAANPDIPYGFGVGLANVQTALIQNNTFINYPYLPVHIEDRSSNVRVDGNKFANSFTRPKDYASHVFIISGSHDIAVTNNVFDAKANTNSFVAIYAGPGGAPNAPYNISISGNTFKLGASGKPLGDYGAVNVKMGPNTNS